MQRRNFLSLLAAIPFLRWFVPKPEPMYTMGIDLAGGAEWTTTLFVLHSEAGFRIVTEYKIDKDGTWHELSRTQVPFEEAPIVFDYDSDVTAFLYDPTNQRTIT